MPAMGLTANSWRACNKQQRGIIEGFRAAFVNAVAPALDPANPHGAFLDSCPQNHEQNANWYRVRVGNTTAMEAVAEWMAGAHSAAGKQRGDGVHVLDAPFPSSSTVC